MIYRRSFYTEVSSNILVTLLVLGGLATLISMGRIISDTANIPADAILTLLGLQLIKNTPQILTAATFAGILITFNRMVQSKELAMWGMAGLNMWHWAFTTIKILIPMAITIWLIALYSAPWSIRFSAEYQHQLANSLKIEDTNPGIFGEVAEQNLIYHLGAISADRSQALGIFIARTSNDEEQIQLVLANRADTEIDAEGLKQLNLDRGQIHNLNFVNSVASKIDFSAGEFNLSQVKRDRSLRLRALAVDNLTTESSDQVELLWRHGFLITAILLGLLALPLGKFSSGAGRGYQVLLAILFYWFYYALMGYTKDLGINEELTPLIAVAIPCLGLGLVTLIFYILRPGRYIA